MFQSCYAQDGKPISIGPILQNQQHFFVLIILFALANSDYAINISINQARGLCREVFAIGLEVRIQRSEASTEKTENLCPSSMVVSKLG